MSDVSVVWWRDIPAQVIVGSGRKALKRELAPRFAEAIDRAAMRSGARDDDAYLAAWRRGAPVTMTGEADVLLASEIARLEADYDAARLARLVANGGSET